MSRTKTVLVHCSLFVSLLILPAQGWAGSIFITGHDPTWHAHFGGNTTGARNLALTGIGYARNGSALPFLFTQQLQRHRCGQRSRSDPS